MTQCCCWPYVCAFKSSGETNTVYSNNQHGAVILKGVVNFGHWIHSFLCTPLSLAGCASAIAWMTGSSVPDADYMNYKEDIKRILLNTTYNPAAGTSFPQKVTAIASATGTATAKAAIRYYQTGCVCKGYAGYAFTAVQSKIYAVALAVAHAYSSAIAEVAEISRDGSK